MTCEHVRALSTPYIDGELPPRARAAVEAHLTGCPACRQVMATERNGRDTLVACRHRLRAVCGQHAASGRRRRWPVAATIALVSAGVVTYGLLSRDATLVAAQLTLDHLKCLYLVSPDRAPGPEVGTQVEASAVLAPERDAMAAWERTYGWPAPLPADASRAGFRLVGIRRCLHGHGFIAHALYRRDDHLVSLFVFQDSVQAAGVLAIMGERAALWTQGAQTYAVVGARTAEELDRFVSVAKSSTPQQGL